VILLFQTALAGSYSFNIYFNLNKFTIKNDDYNIIKQKIDSLSALNIERIEIIGHTDNSADSLYNIRLSLKRANEVKKVFISLGFKEKIVHISYFGEDKPLVDNDNEEDKQLNRRAEIIISYSNNTGFSLKSLCLNDTVIYTKGGKEIVFNACEFSDIENCLEIVEQNTQLEFKKGIVVIGKNSQDLMNYGRLQINLLDGCVDNECFKNPVLIRFPIRNTPDELNQPWALVKGEKANLRLVKIMDKLFYELELNCPTSWINCNCKKNQKH